MICVPFCIRDLENIQDKLFNHASHSAVFIREMDISCFHGTVKNKVCITWISYQKSNNSLVNMPILDSALEATLTTSLP
jgi:hypothetical protein